MTTPLIFNTSYSPEDSADLKPGRTAAKTAEKLDHVMIVCALDRMETLPWPAEKLRSWQCALESFIATSARHDEPEKAAFARAELARLQRAWARGK